MITEVVIGDCAWKKARQLALRDRVVQGVRGVRGCLLRSRPPFRAAIQGADVVLKLTSAVYSTGSPSWERF
jgi:hypothetical protein